MTLDGLQEHDARVAAALELPREEDLAPLPRLPPLQRFYASPAAHTLVPTPVALGLTRIKAELAWRRSEEVQDSACAAMEWLVGASSRAGDVQDLARRHVAANAARTEIEWRHGLGARFPIEGVEVLHDFARGEGGLVHFMHHGPYVHLTGALKAAGVTCYAPIAGFYFAPPLEGLVGHKDRSHLLSLMAGSPVFPAEGSGTVIPKLLAEGRTVGLASDLPGRLEGSFLGRRVLVASGTAKLALATGRKIACLTFRRRPWAVPVVTVHPPIDPAGFSDPAELQAAIFAEHEPAVLAWPEALERPLERWGRPA